METSAQARALKSYRFSDILFASGEDSRRWIRSAGSVPSQHRAVTSNDARLLREPNLQPGFKIVQVCHLRISLIRERASDLTSDDHMKVNRQIYTRNLRHPLFMTIQYFIQAISILDPLPFSRKHFLFRLNPGGRFRVVDVGSIDLSRLGIMHDASMYGYAICRLVGIWLGNVVFSRRRYIQATQRNNQEFLFRARLEVRGNRY